MNYLPMIIIFPLIMAIIMNLLHGKEKIVKYLTFLIAIILIILPFIGQYGYYYFGGYGVIDGWVSGIAYYYNPLKQVVLVVLAIIASLVLIAGMGEKLKNNMFVTLSLMGFASVAAMVLADDLFNFYVFFEIISIVQVGLLFLSGTEEAYKSGLRYMIMGNIAASLMLLGIAFLLASTGTLNITDMKNYILSDNPMIYGGLLLLVVGLSYGSGLPPFHNVKADIYARAKGFISAILQTYSKFILVGFMLIILKLFNGLSYFSGTHAVLLALGVLAMVFGVVMALLQSDYKKLLSYHAISQAGYVATGLALGTPLGIVAGIFHAINHVIYKSALFLGAYIVSHKRGSDLHKLGGLLPIIPSVAFMVLCAKLAISGVPPFNGFQSKWMLAQAAMQVNMPEIAIIMIIVSIGTFVSMMKAFYLIYLKPVDEETIKEYQSKGVPKLAVFSLFILTSLCIILGIYPEIVTKYLFNYAYELGVPYCLK
ncbi:NADH/Ubiquinone/plastoquinone (Complex I) [Methanocaldococcus lauensis]|nr:NADH/Ubiquinone/plastoquinone (Complex I) [Methanocaldococcus lauensis]